MSVRLILAVIAIEVFVAAPLAFWLMWRFAFRSYEEYLLGNTLIALTFVLPAAGGIFLHFRKDKHTNA